mgnify:CR=1 FL=1
MYYYKAYGLIVESEFELLGIRPTQEVSTTDVTVYHARPSSSWAELVSNNNQGSRLHIHVDGLLEFWIEDGKYVVAKRKAQADPNEAEFALRAMGGSFILALVLRQRGMLTLHSSVLHRKGKTIGFVGDSGWGKSTLAEFFSQRGFDVISDDIGVVEVGENSINVRPGQALVKLRNETVEGLLADTPLPSALDDGRVYLHKGGAQDAKRLKLDRLYILNNRFSDATGLKELTEQEITVQLLRHTHGAHIFEHDDYRAQLLWQCSEVARRVSASALNRKRGLKYLEEIADVINKDIAT